MSREASWQAGTWEGARREQLRRALKLSVRERLQAMEALAETGMRLADSARQNNKEAEGDRETKKRR